MSVTEARRKVTIADEFRDSIYVGSKGTGSLLLSRQHCRICRSFTADPTSDPVRNEVDSYWSSIDPLEVYVVIPIMRSPVPGEFWVAPESLEGSIVFGPEYLQLPGRLIADIAEPDLCEKEIDVSPVPEPLPEILKRLRCQLDLPIGDLARVLGLGRRHFYNLSSGANASRETETRVRALSAMVAQLNDELDDAELVRAAVLTPIGPSALTFYEVAERGDSDELSAVLEALIRRIRGRGIRRIKRAVPRPATVQQHEERKRRAREALGGLPPRDPVSRGDPGGAG